MQSFRPTGIEMVEPYISNHHPPRSNMYSNKKEKKMDCVDFTEPRIMVAQADINGLWLKFCKLVYAYTLI